MESSPAGLSVLDDLSTSTPTATNQFISYDGKEKEYVVKFLFRPRTNNNSEVAKTHYAILQAISQIYPEIIIFNNFGKTMTSFTKLMNYNEYLRNFKLQFLKGNESKHCSPIYIALHQMHSKIPISEIRCHSLIADLLEKVKSCMVLHHWGKDEVHISNLGFYVGMDPGNLLEGKALELIKKEIHDATKRPIKKIPCIKVTFTLPFLIDGNGNHCLTKAYGLQCSQQDAKDILSLLKETYKNAPKFIFHIIRHAQPDIYY